MADQGCIFCDIVSGKIKSKLVYRDRDATAFLDINPRNPGHTLVVTNKHHETIMDLVGLVIDEYARPIW